MDQDNQLSSNLDDLFTRGSTLLALQRSSKMLSYCFGWLVPIRYFIRIIWTILRLLTHFFTIPRVFRQPEDVTHVLFDLELTIQRVKVIATPDDKQSHGPFFVVADTFSVFLIIWLGGGVLGCPAFNSSFRATHGSLSLNISGKHSTALLLLFS
ncbi:uncharacterized protein LOC113288035 isoform X2 [Papaver somniferum]|uniref:uncharacterized protein LOC113288035 isoform X2 n=1 Tax=Papaver somniferum TaxID=3469 RepID=UPI000E701986|nr:uncharacterized protein LOC113288035 isoform X2 [Papaver somniferum]